MCRSKHVEQLRNTGIINSTIRLHLVGYFYKIYFRVLLYGSLQLKKITLLHARLSTVTSLLGDYCTFMAVTEKFGVHILSYRARGNRKLCGSWYHNSKISVKNLLPWDSFIFFRYTIVGMCESLYVFRCPNKK